MPEEGIPEPSFTESELAALRMEIEGAALVALIGIGIKLEDRERDLLSLEDGGDCQTAGSTTDDCDFRDRSHVDDELVESDV